MGQGYPKGAVTDPQGPASRTRTASTFRVLRGGAWSNSPDFCRSALRYSAAIARPPDSRFSSCGFRVVVSVSAPGL